MNKEREKSIIEIAIKEPLTPGKILPIPIINPFINSILFTNNMYEKRKTNMPLFSNQYFTNILFIIFYILSI